MISAFWAVLAAALTVAASIGAVVGYAIFVSPLLPIDGNLELVAVAIGLYAAADQLKGASGAIVGAIKKAAAK